MNKVSVIIPVYKNLNEFIHNLSYNIPFLEECDLIIVNDDPESYFPASLQISPELEKRCVWINHTKNEGFSRSVNEGVKQSSSELVLLLNSDVQLTDGTWTNTINAFAQDRSLFAIGFAQKEKDGNIVGRNKLYFEHGLFQHSALPSNEKSSVLLSTSWAECGAGLFRKEMWDILGGLDVHFSPFYWEDVDISYRAVQKGWRVRFAPQVVVKHQHESTTGVYFKDKINSVAYRNQIYFTKKHAVGMQLVELLLFRIKTWLKSFLLSHVRTMKLH